MGNGTSWCEEISFVVYVVCSLTIVNERVSDGVVYVGC